MKIYEKLLVDGIVEEILNHKKYSAGYLANVDKETKKDIIQNIKLFILEYFFKNKKKQELNEKDTKALIYIIIDNNMKARKTKQGEMYKTIWKWIDNKQELNDDLEYENK